MPRKAVPQKEKATKVAPERKTRSKRKVAEPTPVVEPVVETVPAQVDDKPKRKRTVPTRETILEGFDELVSAVDEEIAKLRESSVKSKGVKFLRTVNKKVKALRSQATRVMKQRQRPNRQNNNNSGFLKPVKISREMAKFTGWDPEALKSRVDVTKFVCNYIKEHDLQNPADRRQISVQSDKKLSKLLGYDSAKDDKPLTYYRLQTYMKKHFLKPEDAVGKA